MHTGLERVLMCYVCYRPDIGYIQVRRHFITLSWPFVFLLVCLLVRLYPGSSSGGRSSCCND
jgi:hypothetical protein